MIISEVLEIMMLFDHHRIRLMDSRDLCTVILGVSRIGTGEILCIGLAMLRLGGALRLLLGLGRVST